MYSIVAEARVISRVACYGVCSRFFAEGAPDARGKNGPLSLLQEANKVGGVRQHERIRKTNAWLQSLLHEEEIDRLTRLVLFRCVPYLLESTLMTIFVRSMRFIGMYGAYLSGLQPVARVFG